MSEQHRQPERIQLRRTKGWRKPEGAVVVARPSIFGNPWQVGEPWPEGDPVETQHPATRQDVVDQYANACAGLLIGFPLFSRAELRLLRGRDLACWCPLDQPCHADVLLELANPPAEESP